MFWTKKDMVEEMGKVTKQLEDGFTKLQQTAAIEISSLESKLQGMQLELDHERQLVRDLKEKVRTQTEADIFFMCQKIMDKLKVGETKDVRDELVELGRLQQLANRGTALSRGILGGTRAIL